ncbi:MAG TPA: sigma-70 family RNA polymerase sigma factor [Phenylobacterium sp.]|nr:sigma-70 family RNA polymerase sigma factor [Phenylobacterium sp.]
MPALVFRPFLAVASKPPDARWERAAARRRSAAAAEDRPLDPNEARRFRETLLPHLDAAHGFARFLARDPTAAEDLTQEAYLKAYRSFRGYRGGDARAWLFAIVRSTWLGQTRRGRGWIELTAEEAEAIPDTAQTPEAQLLRQADAAAVRAAVEGLPDPFREAIVLRELQEMSYRDIAQITEVAIGTVMSRLARARSLLAVRLAEEGHP